METKLGTCRLCSPAQELKELRDSHIIPKFVYRWLKLRTPKGRGYRNDAPKIPVQDGISAYWLCSDCEKNFSKLETYFANNFFHKMLDGLATPPIKYDHKLLLFCISVAWRCLLKSIDEAKNNASQEIINSLSETELLWRNYLLQEKSVKPINAHLFYIHPESLKPEYIGPNMYTYGLLSVHGASLIFKERNEALTFSKMGPFFIVAFHQEKSPDWREGKIEELGGSYSLSPTSMPSHFKRWLLNQSQSQDIDLLFKLTDSNKQRIETLLSSNTKEFLSSPSFAKEALARISKI